MHYGNVLKHCFIANSVQQHHFVGFKYQHFKKSLNAKAARDTASERRGVGRAEKKTKHAHTRAASGAIRNPKSGARAARALGIDPTRRATVVIGSARPAAARFGRVACMGELQYPGAPGVDDERQYRPPFRRAPQYRWPAPPPPQPSAFAPWRRAPAPRAPDYRRSASYPGKPDEPYQVTYVRPQTSANSLPTSKASASMVEVCLDNEIRFDDCVLFGTYEFIFNLLRHWQRVIA
ncbi:unnamed protein product, partial [Iphiclides podalirius]